MSGSLNAAVLRWLNDLDAHGIFTTDAELRIQSWNRWLELQTGRTAAQMLGRPLLQAWPELEQRGFAGSYVAALRGQVHVVAQALHGHLLPMRPRPGNRALPYIPQTARIAPLTEDGRPVGTITLIEDVTERMLMLREAELRTQIDALEEARRHAEAAARAKDEFLATLSHELRTPLTAVLGWTRILRAKPLGPQEADRALEVIERNAASQVHLIDDMLDMSRILSGKLRLDVKPVELPAVVAAAADVIAPAALAKGVELRVQLPQTSPRFVGDPDRLQQIVWNLLSNAVKFTPAGGVVDVGLEHVEESLVISVRDSGIGIAPDFLPHVFERFRQGDASISRRHGGLGLGLALVRQLAELHGGTVDAESAGAGQGAAFRVRLPLQGATLDVAAHAPRVLRANADTPPLKDLTVLVVEDDEDTREMMRLLLANQGASVMIAGSCQDAFAALTACTPAAMPAVIVADLAMPDEDGYALIERLPREGAEPAIPVIALTAYASAEDRERALAAGFAAYLTTPMDPDSLTATIVAVISRATRRPQNPAPTGD